MRKVNHQEQIDTAIALAKAASDTATALASAKAQSDIVSANMAKDIEYIKISIGKIDMTLQEEKKLYINQNEHAEVIKEVDDHEKRLRCLEDNISDLPLIRKLVYGCVGIILVLVLTAVIYLIVQK